MYILYMHELLQIGEMLIGNTSLEVFNFSNNDVCGSGANSIANVMKNHRKLKSLNLKNCKMTRGRLKTTNDQGKSTYGLDLKGTVTLCTYLAKNRCKATANMCHIVLSCVV